ncbi:MAG: SPOR domain-containing protein, partial [Desulfobacterales bacterium]|nr:SPOR domain-containing protein [Desulfobacterales bacterium]
IGQGNGVIYLEVHAPSEGLAAVDKKKIFAKLNNIEQKSARALDWGKVEKILTEARGIPVPISEIRPGSGEGVAETIGVRHPGQLCCTPEIPELKTEAWYVLAAIARDENEAARIAAIINHQGPQIPARVLSERGRHRVVAGPFNRIGEAKDAIKRLKIDLEIDGTLIEPVSKI